MTLKSAGAIVAVVSGIVLSAVAVVEYDRGKRDDLHHEGASTEQVKECCDRMDRLDSSLDTHEREDAGWHERIKAMERISTFDSARIQAVIEKEGTDRAEILRAIGTLDGKIDMLLRRQSGSTGR